MLIYFEEIRIYFKDFPTRVCKTFGNVAAHLFTNRYYFLGRGQECGYAFNDRHTVYGLNHLVYATVTRKSGFSTAPTLARQMSRFSFFFFYKIKETDNTNDSLIYYSIFE